MGGRSGGSRDAIMRNLLAENLEKATTKRTVAAIAERNASDADTGAVETEAALQPAAKVLASPSKTSTTTVAAAFSQTKPDGKSDASAETRSDAKSEAKSEPAPLTNGVIQTQPIAMIPGSSEPMKPVKVKTVQIKAGQKLASATPPATPVTNAVPARADTQEISNAAVARTDSGKTDTARADTAKAEIAKPEAGRVEAVKVDMPPQPPGHGTGNGILGVLPASSVASASQAMAYADPSPRPQPQPNPQTGASKPEATHTGWIVQVGALETESEARQRIEAARNQAHGMLNKADPFTEPVVAKGEKKLFRARFAGLDRDQAEAVCRTLKRSDISCITVRN
jgi:D-alanyl-D-alanine carboxypeptidase